MKARIKRFAVVQPVGHRPLKEYPDLEFRDARELSDGMTTWLKWFWQNRSKADVDIDAYRIDVSVKSKTEGQILLNGDIWANYSLHIHRGTPEWNAAAQGAAL
ncbi:hypothetical protein AU252_19855 [Pseudarthrobacter sulfonivorans]|uniref:Uncharacterized protein n=1 Tax=Pseudarthrobacter sulfonivorans TaxID=121292 RepID=A0A0U3P1T1_9MICC|nr:hypothetical protein [Pseudarthrobacter sulfonivorans]ALV43135.1 hypothetical protein AU252_19855 [Pseudarthrobacter sulfonivorans]